MLWDSWCISKLAQEWEYVSFLFEEVLGCHVPWFFLLTTYLETPVVARLLMFGFSRDQQSIQILKSKVMLSTGSFEVVSGSFASSKVSYESSVFYITRPSVGFLDRGSKAA